MWQSENGEYNGKILARSVLLRSALPQPMNRHEGFLPRLIAMLILLGSIAMLAPLGLAVIRLLRGNEPVATAAWLTPLTILALGSILIWLLSRRPAALQLYLAAFALWLITAGYLLMTLLA